MERARCTVTALAAMLFLLVLAGWSSEPATSVLFLGNSYTHSNDLPGVVEAIAESQGVPVDVEMHAPGGWWLEDHAGSQASLDAIAHGDFDVVVLQEQSMAPAVRRLAETETRPADSTLVTRSSQSGASVVLFMTWGHRSGSAEVGHSSYESMQRALAENYEWLAETTATRAAPVGAAWWMSLHERSDLALYQSDGSHPTPRGTYLAAAVLAGTLFDVDVEEADAVGVDEEEALALRQFAARALAGERPWG